MPKVALLSRDISRKLDESRFRDVAAALWAQGLDPVACPYDEARETEVAATLRTCEAALVWVNPVQDGRDRRRLDALLRRAEVEGLLVSARPDVIDRLGVKAVLAATRAMGWSGDAEFYQDADALSAGLARTIATGPRVLKPNRGNGGAGVWKVEDAGEGRLRVMEASSRRPAVELDWDAFLEDRRREIGPADGFVDQAFQPRLGDGMIRCYMAGDRVAGFGWQQVRALLDTLPAPPRAYSGPSDPRFQVLRRRMEDDWTLRLAAMLDLGRDDLPAIWDADFLFGPRDAAGQDTFVLCEINASSVSPMPAEAPEAMAATLVRRLAVRLTRQSA